MSIPNPGSQAAQEQGCLCPVLDNGHGRGNGFDGCGNWWIVQSCPLHGKEESMGGGNMTILTPEREAEIRRFASVGLVSIKGGVAAHKAVRDLLVALDAERALHQQAEAERDDWRCEAEMGRQYVDDLKAEHTAAEAQLAALEESTHENLVRDTKVINALHTQLVTLEAEIVRLRDLNSEVATKLEERIARGAAVMEARLTEETMAALHRKAVTREEVALVAAEQALAYAARQHEAEVKALRECVPYLEHSLEEARQMQSHVGSCSSQMSCDVACMGAGLASKLLAEVRALLAAAPASEEAKK